MVVKSKVCPETSLREWAKIILQAHTKGYLYVMFEKGKPYSVSCAYRIPTWDEKFTKEMPHTEDGNILYVAWAVSESPNKTNLLKMLREYRKIFPKVKELIYYKRNSDTDLKRIKLKEF